MMDVERVRAALASGEQQRIEDRGPRAAVAPILRAGETGLELLFIERARRLGDPWSGHLAFPGGRVDPEDTDSRATAERETREEIDLDLSRAEYLGRLDDLAGRRNSGSHLSIAAHVYWWLLEPPELRPNYEVADAFWIQLDQLVDPSRYVDYRYPAMPFKKFPGVRVGEGKRVVWGLTFRFLEDLFARLEQPFPVRR